MAKYTTGAAFIDLLNAHGVDKVFINPGGENISILADVASARVQGKDSPQLVLCLDEAVAASAAYGNFMVSGKPQMIVVHSEIGILQLGANLINLQWGRIPAVILAAYNEADTHRTTWDGQPFDQGSIVRNSVKYERKLNGDEDIHEVLTAAFNVACTEPKGPVYISFPTEYLFREIDKPAALPTAEAQALPPVDMQKLGQMADILLNAKNPLIVSGYAGRYHENVAALVTLAETLCAQMLTGYSWMNFPSNHPLCVGIEQIGGSRKMDAGYANADVILAIDYAMPYVASAPPPNPDAKILHIDIDPFTQGRPLWWRGADIFMKTDARKAIPALEKLLKDKMTAEQKARLDKRFSQIAEQNEKIRQQWYTSAQSRAGDESICPDYLSYCLNQLIDEDTIVINHTLSHCASVTEQIVRTKPGTWFGCPSGAIGWAPGAALGAAAAAPEKLVVAVMTDGGFVWGCPTATLWGASNYRFPFLSIICNNKGYGAVRGLQQGHIGMPYPDEQYIAESAVDFMPDYAKIAQGAGAYGRTVSKSDDVLPALKEALAAVRNGQPAVLDVQFAR